MSWWGRISIMSATARRGQDEVREPMRAAGAVPRRRPRSQLRGRLYSGQRQPEARVVEAPPEAVEVSIIPLLEEGQAPRLQEFLSTSAIWSAMGPTMMAPGPLPFLLSRKRSLPDRSRSDL